MSEFEANRVKRVDSETSIESVDFLVESLEKDAPMSRGQVAEGFGAQEERDERRINARATVD